MTLPWLTCYGQALTEKERHWLKDAAYTVSKAFPKTVIVNIGVCKFASMYCLRVGAPKATLIGVDIVLPSRWTPHKELQAEYIIEDSRTAYKKFTRPIHLLFVDGDHHYPVVKSDLENWGALVVSGGIVACHDYKPLPVDIRKNPHLVQVKQAVDEWAAARPVDWTPLPAPDSLRAFQRK